MAGAFASKILAGTSTHRWSPWYCRDQENHSVLLLQQWYDIYIGRIVSGRTKVDILVTPLVCIVSGSSVGLILGPPISAFMTWLGSMINWGTEQAPFLMGIVVSILMGMILTLPIQLSGTWDHPWTEWNRSRSSNCWMLCEHDRLRYGILQGK